MRANQKRIRELLETYATAEGKLQTLQSQREAAVKPLHDKFYKQVERVDKGFQADIEEARLAVNSLRENIENEIRSGFDTASNSFAIKKVESENAFVEINTREEREISSAEWLAEVPAAEQSGKFFDTMKVLVTKAEKFRSDIVERLATMKRTHTVSIRLK